MVRTYRKERYELISPWEQAMKNADSDVGRPILTGKRTYNDVNVSHRSGHKNLKLPPITEDQKQLGQFLTDEVGKILSRSKERLRKIKGEVILYDPLETGFISKLSAYEILKRYHIPKEEGYQRKLVEMFIDEQNKAQVNRKAFIDFLENSRKSYKVKIEQEEKQEENQQSQQQPKLADSQLGRYDSQPTMQQEQIPRAKRGELVREAFHERRDAGLLLEVESAMDSYSAVNPNELITKLEQHLMSTCRNESNLVDNMHMKGLVDKHQFPINSALTIKCIDRLDPHDQGQIEWPKFIEFLRRAVQNSPRYIESRSNTSTSKSEKQASVPQTPAWETRKPLSSISRDERKPHERQYGNHKPDEEQQYDQMSHREESPFHLNDDFLNNSNNGNHNQYQHYNNNEHQPDDYNQEKKDNRHDRSYDMADDLEAAFAYNLDKIQTGDDGMHGNQNFQIMGVRGEAYKRIADALQDKGKFSNGIVETNEVKKLVNYYNLLFDTNISMEQLDQVLSKYSSSDQIQVEQIINTFGTEIL